MLSGSLLYVALLLLALWVLFLCGTVWKLLGAGDSSHRQRATRDYLTIIGIGLSAVAVAALFALHVTWISPAISQRLGAPAIRILSLLVFWPSIAAVALTVPGAGRIRFLAAGTSAITILWVVWLGMGSAISMGPPLARHPTKFLIPEGYVGWVTIKHGEGSRPLELSHGMFICQIPVTGVLETSTPLEEGWASDGYFYYSAGGSLKPLRNTGWGGGGMIWSGIVERGGAEPSVVREKFYVGTEEQYRRNESEPPH